MIMVRLTDLYECDTYLNSGKGIPLLPGSHTPTRFRKDVIKKMNLEYKNTPNGKMYFGDENNIWDYFKSAYNEVLKKKRIDSYNQLVQYVRSRRIF